jgi:hypothetical protein
MVEEEKVSLKSVSILYKNFVGAAYEKVFKLFNMETKIGKLLGI